MVRQAILVTGAALLILLGAATAPGLGADLKMAGGPHDFRNQPTYVDATGTGNEVCKACHIPHNASQEAFLWSRDYGTAEVPSDWQSGSTLLCMGCHDGQIASTINGTPYNVSVAKASAVITAATKSHKVNVAYPPPGKAGFNETISLPLESGQMTCGTCHDPHEPPTANGGKRAMLRIDNTGSALCIECHVK